MEVLQHATRSHIRVLPPLTPALPAPSPPPQRTSYTRLRMSMKRMARPSNWVSGTSYMSHMTLAASMGEPPPRAMITSGLNSSMSARPALMHARVGSGATW